jgi:hypothetical protein
MEGRVFALCEWDVNGQHKTHGFASHEPTLRDLLANVSAVLGIDANRGLMEAVSSEQGGWDWCLLGSPNAASSTPQRSSAYWMQDISKRGFVLFLQPTSGSVCVIPQQPPNCYLTEHPAGQMRILWPATGGVCRAICRARGKFGVMKRS